MSVPGGLPPMRPDQALQPQSRAGSGPAPQQSVIQARLVIISGPGSGLFVYTPVPGANNLFASIASQAGVDPFGNQYLAGFTTYNFFSGTWFALQHSQFDLQWWIGGATQATPYSPSASVQVQVFGDGVYVGVQPGFSIFGGGGTTERALWITPSGDTTGVTDVSAIQSGLNAGAVCNLMPGNWYTNVPITIPDQTALICPNPSWGTPSGGYGAGSLPLQGAIINPTSTFAGSAVISMGSAGTTQHGGQRIYGITINGSNLPAANTAHGIESQGYVAGVKIRDVLVYGGYNSGTTTGLGGNGLYAHNDGTAGHNPDFWQVDASKFSQCGQWGIQTIALSDSWFTNCEATGNNSATGGGWQISNGNSSRYIGCRGDSNTGGDGWSLIGLAAFTGTLQFSCCEANLNGTGLAISGTGTGRYYLNGFKSIGNTTAQYSYAGTMNVSSDAAYNVSTAAPTLS